MTDHAVPAFSRVCPECGRRVPSKVPSCRCGCVLEEAADTAEAAHRLKWPIAGDHQPARRAAGLLRRSSPRWSSPLRPASTVFFWMRQTPPAAAGRRRDRGADRPARAATPGGANRLAAPRRRRHSRSCRTATRRHLSSSRATRPRPRPWPSPLSSLEDVISRAMPAVVRVESADGFGSGFFVAPDTILTNVHVVGEQQLGHDPPDRRHGRRRRGSTRRRRSSTSRSCASATRIPDQPTLTMGSGMNARAGQEIIALGTPLGLQNTVTRGIVSAVREVGGVTLVQTDAAINPGNSGGPLLDRAGAVIGIATMGMRSAVAQGLSFGVAIEHAQSLLAGRRSVGNAARPPPASTQAMSGRPGPTASDTVRDEGGAHLRAGDRRACAHGRRAGRALAQLQERVLRGARRRRLVRPRVVRAVGSARDAGRGLARLRAVVRRHPPRRPGHPRPAC